MTGPLIYAIVAINLIILTNVSRASYLNNLQSDDDNDNPQARLARATTALTGEFLYDLAINNPGETTSVSVLPLLSALGVFAQYAHGSRYDEIMSLLNLSSLEEIRNVFPIAIKDFNSEKGVFSKLSMKIYGDERHPFSKSFKENYAKYFSGDTGTVDYCDPEEAAKGISNWVRNQTIKPNHFSDLVSPKMIRENGIIQVSTHNFIVNWDNPFNPEGMRNISFRVNENEAIEMPALYGNGYLNYMRFPELKVQALEVPFFGGKYGVQVLFPDEGVDLNEVLVKLDPEAFDEIYAKQKRQCITIYLPLGEVNMQMDLGESLKKALNATRLFDRNGGHREDRRKRVTKYSSDPYLLNILHELHLIGNGNVDDPRVPSSNNGSTVPQFCSEGSFSTVKINRPFAYYVTFYIGKYKSTMLGGLYYKST